MASVTLRKAVQSDFLTIKQLIKDSNINPFGLSWERFIVAEADGQFVGCGQLKPHGDGSVELASIAVLPAFRQQKVATLIMNHLIKAGPRPLYLTCRSELQTFYEKFNFRVLSPNEMTPYFRRLYRFASIFIKFMPNEHSSMLVMALDAPKESK